jgi:hypothetical protein
VKKYRTIQVADNENMRSYYERQMLANTVGAALYVEFHFNAKNYDKPGSDDNPAMVLVADNASERSRQIARDMAEGFSLAFDIPNRSVLERVKHQRGWANLVHTNMPAVLVEPLYVSDPDQARLAMSEEGQSRIANIIASVINDYIPEGSLIALNCGHKFKPYAPFDRGAPISKEVENPDSLAEADLAEMVMHKVDALLTGGEKPMLPAEQGEVLLSGEWAIKAVEGGILLRKVRML